MPDGGRFKSRWRSSIQPSNYDVIIVPWVDSFKNGGLYLVTRCKRFLGAGLLMNSRVIRITIKSKGSDILDLAGLT